PDGRLLAFRSGPNAIEVREKEKGTLIRRLESEDGVSALAFTSDGTRLVAGGYTGWFVLWHLGTGQEEWKKYQGRERGLARRVPASVAISRDGRRLATSGGGTALVLRDVSSGEIIATLEDDPRLLYQGCAFNVEGTQLTVGCSGFDERFGLVKVFDVAAGRNRFARPPPPSSACGVSCGPGRRRIA